MPQSGWIDQNYSLIKRIIKHSCYVMGIYDDEVDDFTNNFCEHLFKRPKLMEQIASSRNQASYLTTAITNYIRDELRQRKGRWRPSASAQQSGSTAVLLEKLLNVESMKLEEAYHTLTITHQIAIDRKEFSVLVQSVKLPNPKTFHDPDAVDQLVSNQVSWEAARKKVLKDEMIKVLRESIEKLANEDKLLIRHHFEKDISLSKTARILGMRRYVARHRLKNNLKQLARELKAKGFDEEAFKDL